MEYGFLRILIIGIFIALCYGAVKLISYATKGKIIADGFAAINAFLYVGLVINLFVVIDEPFPSWITILVIIGGLLYRRKSSGRWI
tara:strand:+ start:157 stop:414 length:258 start_codon:yes stop_codon:yes gene_type:complete